MANMQEDQTVIMINFTIKFQVRDEMIAALENFNKHVEKRIHDFKAVHSAYGIGKRNVERKNCLGFEMKRSCVANT